MSPTLAPGLENTQMLEFTREFSFRWLDRPWFSWSSTADLAIGDHLCWAGPSLETLSNVDHQWFSWISMAVPATGDLQILDQPSMIFLIFHGCRWTIHDFLDFSWLTQLLESKTEYIVHWELTYFWQFTCRRQNRVPRCNWWVSFQKVFEHEGNSSQIRGCFLFPEHRIISWIFNSSSV